MQVMVRIKVLCVCMQSVRSEGKAKCTLRTFLNGGYKGIDVS